ncbi:hypothetical protein QBC45DRAFT_445466 [Copromyces sp. CBS 386.78]|nr:hypothetical protein QBC45DRAFT_445466 [Copromyces sp. CBS 386.78]
MSEPPAITTHLPTAMPQMAGGSLNHRHSSCFPPGQAPLERLPNEILVQICDLAVPEQKGTGTVTQHRSFNDRGIRALALASKRMQPIAQEAMYKSIVLDNCEKSVLLLKSLLLFPHNRELVRHLEVRPPVKLLRPEGAEPTRFFDFHLVLDTVYKSEECNPQLPSTLLNFLRLEFCRLPGEAEWNLGRYPQGGFYSVIPAIKHLCGDLKSFKVQIMGQWCGSSCDYTKTQPKFIFQLASIRYPVLDSNHLRILDLDVASIAIFTNRPTIGRTWRATCPPAVSDLTLRHEDASLSSNFLDSLDDEDIFDDSWDHRAHAPTMDDLFHFIKPCSASLRKLRLLGGFDHAGLMIPSITFGPRAVSKSNWNTILPHFPQLEHLEFSGYGNPCPPDDTHRNTLPDNIYRYGTGKTLRCLAQLPNLRYLKLPLVDLFPLSPAVFPDTARGLRDLMVAEIDWEVPWGTLSSEVLDVYGRLRRDMAQSMEALAQTLETGRGPHYNIEQKLLEAARGAQEIPRNLEKVELYYFVKDTDKNRDPRELWAKSAQYASLDRREIESHEVKMALEGGWFPTKEKTFTWTRGY